MLFFGIGLVIGVVAFITIDILVRKHNEKKAKTSDIEDLENKK